VLRVAGIVLPVVLLVSAVSAGLVGPREVRPAATARAIAQDPARDAPSTTADPEATPVATPAPVVFPTVAADLAVLTVDAAVSRFERAASAPYAIRGYITAVGAYAPCAAANGDPRGDPAMCLRHAQLDLLSDDPENGPRLAITITPGTRLPTVLDGPGPGRPVPIVVVGHPGPRPDPCHPTTQNCGDSFVVERVTWADGEPFEPGPVFDVYLDIAPPGWPLSNLEAAETLTIGWSGTILQRVLLRRTTVPMLDVDAARVMAPSPTVATLVWYVLGLETGYDPERHLHGSAPPRYSWVVVDYVTGETLARGPARLAQP